MPTDYIHYQTTGLASHKYTPPIPPSIVNLRLLNG